MKNWKMIVGIGCAAASTLGWSEVGTKKDVQVDTKRLDRRIELTVYKDDFGMVSESRPVRLQVGHSRLVVDDISKQLDPNSILFDWPNPKNHPRVIATTYDLGVGAGTNIVSRLNGHEIELMWPTSDGRPGQSIRGTLESPDGAGYSLRTADKLYVNPGGIIVASSETASTLPQLSVEMDSEIAGDSRVGISYLTQGLSWSADYVAKLNPSSNSVELECWATITNHTGIPFPLAKLTLMAGEVNRAVKSITLSPTSVIGGSTSNSTVNLSTTYSPIGGVAGLPVKRANVDLASNVARQTVGDMYAYEIPSSATIGVDQMNRVSVLGNRTVPVTRIYTVRVPGLSSWGMMDMAEGYSSTSHLPAEVTMTFVNEGSSHLGIPLPSGAVRVYEKDPSGRERYTGADQINDTPKNERVTLSLAKAFDVYGSYHVVKSTKVSKHKVRKVIEAVIHNEKAKAIQVRIDQAFAGQYVIVEESQKSQKLDSQSVRWKLPVKAGEAKKLTFTVEMKF